MADNKKYYYMRLKENFFDTEEMVLLEALENGILYSNILLKLYLKSLKFEGRLLFKDTIPYSTQMIATVIRQPIEVVESAIEVFKSLDLVTVLEDNVMYMSEIELFIGQASTEADRKRAARKKIDNGEMRGIPERTNGGQMSDKRSREIRDKSIESKDKSKENREEITSASTLDTPPPSGSLIDMNYMKIKQYFEQQVIFQESDYQQNRQLSGLLDDYNDPLLIIEGMKVAVERGIPKLPYINGILKTWRSEGIVNINQLQAKEVKNYGASQSPNGSYNGRSQAEIELFERMRNYSSPAPKNVDDKGVLL